MMSASEMESAFPRRIIPLLISEGIVTLGITFLQLGFYFYATHQWGWQPRNNLLLAAAQGLAYVCGALSARFVSDRLGRHATVVLLPISFAILAVICGIFPNAQLAVASLTVVVSFLTACHWPNIESLVAAGAEAEAMARRLATYNLIWPIVSALGMAACGYLIDRFPVGFFYISAVIDCIGGLVLLFGGPQPRETPEEVLQSLAGHALPVEPILLRQRKLALWLSRIALPSTYVVVYALAAIMPTLPSLSSQPITAKTIIASIWLVGRWAGFLVLAASSFWQKRPKLLIVASVIMLIAFVWICIPVSAVTGGKTGSATDLIAMSIAQFVLGVVLALIYSASLYFGMVLSNGSTEHGGYHEALIGMGQVLGPGVAAAAQWIQPGSIAPTTLAISVMILISLGASGYAMVHFQRLRAAPAIQ